MHPKVTLWLRDGSKEVFESKRLGDGAKFSLRYESGMAIVIDQYGTEKHIPQDLIQFIETLPAPRGF